MFYGPDVLYVTVSKFKNGRGTPGAWEKLRMREYMKAKQGTAVHETTNCDRDWENEDTGEETGERRGEFKSEGVSEGGQREG